MRNSKQYSNREGVSQVCFESLQLEWYRDLLSVSGGKDFFGKEKQHLLLPMLFFVVFVVVVVGAVVDCC